MAKKKESRMREHPTNLIDIEIVVADLERLAKSLPVDDDK